jgi:uncharacterized membrane protein YczE
MNLSQTSNDTRRNKTELFADISLSKIGTAFLGIFFVGIAIAFNARAGLGNDPIGILYDGVRAFFGLSSDQLGMASNIVNIMVLILVFFIGRHYVNLGTFIYILPYGFAVDLGNRIFETCFPVDLTLFQRILAAGIGSLFLYIGVALYITIDIGLDPFTGLVMSIKDLIKREYRVVKIVFDILCTIIGFLMGGKLGLITVLCAVIAGPLIQFFSGLFSKLLSRLRIIK